MKPSTEKIHRCIRGLRLVFRNVTIQRIILVIRHIALKLIHKNPPEFFFIGLTNQCQCKCMHCSSSAPVMRECVELETSLVKSLIDQAIELAVLEVIFYGGEPMLRKDLPEMIQYAHERGMVTRVDTNGLLLDRDHVSELKRAGLTICDVSIDDPDPAEHDHLRGVPGLFDKVIAGIKHLREARILCEISTYASKRNVEAGLARIIELGKELGVFSVFINLPKASGLWYEKWNELLDERERESVRSLIEPGFVHMSVFSNSSRCKALSKISFYISPKGAVTPCPFIPYPIGNVKSDTLKEIWKAYSKRLLMEHRGDCIMNDPTHRSKYEKALTALNKPFNDEAPRCLFVLNKTSHVT